MPLGAARAVITRLSGGGTPGSTGLLIASAGANVNDGGNTAWTSPGNITTDDATRTTCLRTSSGTSQLLRATFDLSTVPDGSTITGVVVRLQRDYSSTTPPQSVRDHTIRLTKDGTNMVGDNKADTATDWIHQVDTNVDYGGSSDLWGTTLTAAEVKAALFGVMIKVSHLGSISMNARADAVWMNVHYLT